MSSYPSNGSRGSRGAGGRAVAVPLGSPMGNGGGSAAPWFRKSAGFWRAGGFVVSAAVTAIGLVEWYRAYQGGGYVANADWTYINNCGPSIYGPYQGDHVSPCPIGNTSYFMPFQEGIGGSAGNWYCAYMQTRAVNGPFDTGIHAATLHSSVGAPAMPPVRQSLPIWVPVVYTAPAVPVGQPARPMVPPITGPVSPTLPEDSVGGYAPPAVAPAVPGLGSMPGLSWTPAGVRPLRFTGVRVVAATNVLEKKLRMRRGVGFAVHLFNQFTEWSDAIGAIHDALPKRCQEDRKATPALKAAAVAGCFGAIDWNQALFNLVWENVEDRAWAMLGLPTKQAGLPYGANAPVNIALGKLYGDNLANALKDVRGATAGAVNQMFGTNIKG